MNLPAVLSTIFWLARDTFRQSLASGIFWLMLAFNVVCIALCLSVGVSGEEPPVTVSGEKEKERLNWRTMTREELQKAVQEGIPIPKGELRVLFGSVRIDMARWYASDIVRFLQLLLAGGVAGVTGILLALVWTAGFFPEFLQPSAASVLLAKPVPRWSLLAGKYLGVLVFLTFQAVVFVGGTWLALGVKTGYFLPGYLLCIPLLVLNFAVVYSFSALLAVHTRSTVACVFGVILFWLVCWAMNYGRVSVVAHAAHPDLSPDLQPHSTAVQTVVEVSYWIMPKPYDLAMLLDQAIRPEDSATPMPAWDDAKRLGAFHPLMSVLSSILFAAVMLGLAGWQFVTTDY